MDFQEERVLINNSRGKSKRRVPVLLMVVMWSLGIIDWSPPRLDNSQYCLYLPIFGRSRLHRKITFVISVGILFTMALTAYFGAVTYIICFFGVKEHFLRFVIVVVCYYPSLMSGTIFYLPAFFSNKCTKSQTDEFNLSWKNLFHESAFLQRLKYLKNLNMCILPRLAVYVFFNICSLTVSFVILILHTVFTECLTWITYIWGISEFIGLVYMAQFCYFLYLQRVSLEEEYKEAESYIKTNAGELKNCIKKVKELFRNYFQLRKLFLLWLSIIFFSITFGIAAYCTWSYNKPKVPTNSTESLPTPYPIHPKGIKVYCPYSCDDPKYLQNEHNLLIYNVLVFAKLLIPAVLSLSVMRGLDIKYMWNRFMLRLRLMTTTDNLEFWNTLIGYTKELHLENQLDTKLTFIIPILGLAFGFVGGLKSHE